MSYLIFCQQILVNPKHWTFNGINILFECKLSTTQDTCTRQLPPTEQLHCDYLFEYTFKVYGC